MKICDSNPYNKINAGLNDENIIKYFSQLKKNDEKVKDIKHMFDDFDLYQQIDEITPEEDYENLIALLLETSRAFTEEE